MRHLDFLFTGLSPSGLLYPFFNSQSWQGQHDGAPEGPPITLTRRVGDALYSLVRKFLLLRERGLASSIKPEWETALRNMLAAVAGAWERFGDLGQYLHLDTGDVVVAGTTSGALVPAGFVLATEYFSDEAYLKTAAEIGEFYRQNDLADGITTGGPGDAMQAPDSESVAQLIESFILLYERTRAEKWRVAAAHAVAQKASWVMSYDYQFPAGTAFAEIDAQTRGVIIANAQNKTGVPGICTLSGQGLLRAYRATGERRYLTLLQHMCHTMPQFMGRPGKTIKCRFSGGNPHTEMPDAWICERVNITQWGEPIGELMAYSTWCEVAMMLVWCDIPGIYVDLEQDEVVVLDHVEAELVRESGSRVLRIHNPTSFPARVKILAEGATERAQAMPINAALAWPVVSVKAGETAIFDL